MGIDDLINDKKSGDGDEPEDSEEESNSKDTQREYVKISKEEMDEFFDERPEHWVEIEHPQGELVYATKDFAKGNSEYALNVFSSIKAGTGRVREEGSDAIRTVVWHMPSKMPITGKKKTLRIKTWRKNLTKKIDSLVGTGKDTIEECDQCGSPMVRREGEYGEFFGCSAYPDCENTKQLD